MCTAISVNSNYHLFGRTLDLEHSFGENVVIISRNFELSFRHEGKNSHHYAMLGTAALSGNTPLFFDAMNEKGLCVAALNFPELARYHEKAAGKCNLASFEVIPWILSRFDSAAEAMAAMQNANITLDSFSEEYMPTPLHWIVADSFYCFVIESVRSGLNVIENPFGVLTNSPDFEFHTQNLANHMSLSPAPPENAICPNVALRPSSRGIGAFGLPGDMSSPSRFIRTMFAKTHTQPPQNKKEAISRFFHIIGTVNQPCGFAQTDSGKPICTRYTCCMDTEELIYYFTDYQSRHIRAIRLTDLPSDELCAFPFACEESIEYLN